LTENASEKVLDWSLVERAYQHFRLAWWGVVGSLGLMVISIFLPLGSYLAIPLFFSLLCFYIWVCDLPGKL